MGSSESTLLVLEGFANMCDMPDPRRVAARFKQEHTREELCAMDASELARVFMRWDRIAQPIQSYEHIPEEHGNEVLVYLRIKGAKSEFLHVVVRKGCIIVPQASMGPGAFCKVMDIPHAPLRTEEESQYQHQRTLTTSGAVHAGREEKDKRRALKPQKAIEKQQRRKNGI